MSNVIDFPSAPPDSLEPELEPIVINDEPLHVAITLKERSFETAAAPDSPVSRKQARLLVLALTYFLADHGHADLILGETEWLASDDPADWEQP